MWYNSITIISPFSDVMKRTVFDVGRKNEWGLLMDEYLEENVEDKTNKFERLENALSSSVKNFEDMDNNAPSITEGLEINING